MPTYTPDAHSWVELARACRERGLPIVESVTVMAARLHLDEIAGTGEQIGRRSPCVDVAVAVCEGCPIRVQCLEYAMAASEPGIWGGLTDRGRREERARRRRTRHHRS